MALFVANLGSVPDNGDDWKCRLTPKKPAHRIKEGTPVRFSLRNGHWDTPATMPGPAHWSVWKGQVLVYSPITSTSGPITVKPGEAHSWEWVKVDSDGKLVSPGSYTLKVGPIIQGSLTFDLQCDVALTESGTIAGLVPLPLMNGNEWEYAHSKGSATPMKMTVSSLPPSYPGWFRVKNFVGKSMLCKIIGATKSVLYTSKSLKGTTSAEPLLDFGQNAGHMYDVSKSGFGKTRVVVNSTSDTAMTPVGGIPECFVFRAEQKGPGSRFGFFVWFAPGLGVAEYVTEGTLHPGEYRLRRAKVIGLDGRPYSIGSP